MSKIDPTVGKTVWFNPPYNSANHAFAPASICAAIVAAVLPDGRVNLAVFDGNGACHSMERVPFIQAGDESPENGYYAEWIPDGGRPVKAEPSPFSAAANPVVPPPASTPVAPPAPAPLSPVVTSVETIPVTTTSQPVA
jgi:hypothetical protein